MEMYDGLRNLRKKRIQEFPKDVLNVLLIFFISCTNTPTSGFNIPPLVSIDGEIVDEWPVHKKPDTYYLLDVRGGRHGYKQSNSVVHLKEIIDYCKLHKGWEIIKPYWDSKTDDFVYYVRRHRKF